MKIPFFAAFSAVTMVVATGCQTRRGPTVGLRPATVGQRAGPASPASFERAAPIGSLGSVRSPETVKAYGVNRYVDPVDGRLMHERHAIYRLEKPGAWVSRPPDHAGEVLLGPVLGLTRAEYRPEPIPGETAQALAQQRRALEEAAAGVGGLQESQRQLADNLVKLGRQSADAQQKLTAIVTVLNERLKRLENDPAAKTESGPSGAEGSGNTAVGGGGATRNPE